MSRPRIAAILLICLSLLAGCAPAGPRQVSADPAATPLAPTVAPTAPPPTVAPSPTPPPTFAAGSTIAGVDVGGLTLALATEVLRDELGTLPAIELRAGEATLELEASAIGLEPQLEALLATAEASLGATKPARVPLALTIDAAALRGELETLAEELAVPPAISVITGTEVLSRSFAYTPGLALDVDAAVEQLAAELADGETGPFELELAADEVAPRVSLEQLQEQVAELAGEWKGVVGFHLHDLASGEAVGFQDQTVFAGASTIKTAIMLYAYANVERFDKLEEGWLKEMIVESDNLAANGLLAAGAGGQGTELAFAGADEMSTILQEQLGLKHTYLYVPYETTDYIKLYKPKFRCGPAGPVGQKPYTEMGACLRAEPASMARLYVMLDQCASGDGPLLAAFEKLSAKRCQEMLDRLETNDDTSRMVAGIPEGVRVEHKSGWIENMNGDVGIVRSPNGDYVLAVYIYKPLPEGRFMWKDEEMAPVIAAFSRLAYTAYNPVRLEPDGE